MLGRNSHARLGNRSGTRQFQGPLRLEEGYRLEPPGPSAQAAEEPLALVDKEGHRPIARNLANEPRGQAPPLEQTSQEAHPSQAGGWWLSWWGDLPLGYKFTLVIGLTTTLSLLLAAATTMGYDWLRFR